MTLANNTKSEDLFGYTVGISTTSTLQENSSRADAAIIKGAPRLFKYYDPWVRTHSTCVYASSTTNTSKYIVKTLSFRKFANTCLKASSCKFIWLYPCSQAPPQFWLEILQTWRLFWYWSAIEFAQGNQKGSWPDHLTNKVTTTESHEEMKTQHLIMTVHIKCKCAVWDESVL